MALDIKNTIIRSIRYSIALSILLTSASVMASELKPRIKVSTTMVSLSDIFTDVSYEADKILFEAPLPGRTMQISLTKLWNIAQSNNIEWEKPLVNRRIRIMREGRRVNMAALVTIIEAEVKSLGVSGNIQVKVNGSNKNLYLPLDSDEVDIEISNLNLSQRQDRYSAELMWPVGNGAYADMSINGTIENVHLIPVLNKIMIPGDTVKRGDIDWINVSIKQITSNTLQSVEDFIGFTPRRAITANKLLRKSDFEALKLVRKGSQVTLTLRSGPLTLTTMGKALEHGALGDSIRIMNLSSSKVIYAVVTNVAQVEINRLKPAFQLAAR